jgi:hypothetical protein
MAWLERLKALAERHPLVILRFGDDELDMLLGSRRGLGEFTVAIAHDLLKGVHIPSPCIVLGDGAPARGPYFGLLTSKASNTTLQTRVKFSRGVSVNLGAANDLASMLASPKQSASLAQRLEALGSATRLSPKLGVAVIDGLAAVTSNRGPLRTVAESLTVPDTYSGPAAMQEDAVHTAMAAFGLAADARALKVDVVDGRDTAVARVPLVEDAVIEHDARAVPGFALVSSDVTGRAIFQNGAEQLEVITANRRDLEHCFGVDLIYVNLTKDNVVMLQYKMLEPSKSNGNDTDWIYRPDGQLNAELARMKLFDRRHRTAKFEYRLNCTTFYFKFVKRDAALASPCVITPLDHFEKIMANPSMKGPRNGKRISFQSLDGRYLRQGAFLDLLRFGYIGAYGATSAKLKSLIDAVLAGDRALVTAVQRQVAQS